MNRLTEIFYWATAQQDYAWFLATLGWLSLGIMIAATPRTKAGRDRWPFLALAAAGLWQASTELVWHALPPEAADRYSPRLAWDLTLAAGLGASLLAMAGAIRLKPVVRGLVLATVAALLATRRLNYLSTSDGLALVGLMLAWTWWRELRTARVAEGWRIGALCSGLLPLFSTVGPLAELTTDMHRNADLSRWALPSAAVHLAAALGFVVAWWREYFGPEHSARQAGGLRPFVFGLTVWLGLGLGLAVLAGRQERLDYETQLLARVATAAEWMNKNVVAACLTEDFKIQGIKHPHQLSGRENPGAQVPFLATAVTAPLRKELTRVERTSRDALWAHVMTIHDGWLLTFSFSERIPALFDFAPIHRRAAPEDFIDWSERHPRFDQPEIGGWGETVRARAPLVDEHHRMLGWLALEFGAVDWTASQARARLLAFAIVALGGSLMLLWLLRSWTVRAQQEALLAARNAEVADQAKSAFLARVSHELRTPIQSVLGYADLLGRTPMGPLHDQRREALRQHGELMLRLVNDLIDISAAQAGAFRLQPTSVSLPALITESVESLRPRAEARQLFLSCQLDPGVPRWVQADAMRLRQVIYNLVGNAIKYTDHGRIDVTLSGEGQAGSGPIRCQLTVRDTGPGIPPDQQMQIFKPFSRLDQTAGREGVGLGLALSRALCVSMGGGLRVESDGRQGSVFIADFVFLACPAPDPVATVERIDPTLLAGRRVLVAEDNNLVRELFASHLRELGAHCDVVADGEAAVERALAGNYDAVLLDLSMPKLDGVEAARRIRAAGRRQVRLIGVSAHADLRERDRACANGMDDFLFKPVDLGVLANTLAGVSATAGSGARDRAKLVARLGLREVFIRESAPLLDELQRAVTAGDWTAAAARAHYLKNSADVLDLPVLGEWCRLLEVAAADPAPDAAREALVRIREALGEWRPTPSL
jgi:signal transduction histidine kinase/CheY-like chemotaxis protein